MRIYFKCAVNFKNMGRRPSGRKYRKHISIQVKEVHNEDLKLLAAQLSSLSKLSNGKKWTIRDIILTHLYSQYNNSPEWYENNHFENLTDDEIEKIRQNIGGDTRSKKILKQEKQRPKQVLKHKEKTKLKVKLNPNYASYLKKMTQIKQEDQI